jgi:hypothetical protein
MAKASLNFCRGEGEEANSLRSNSLLSFSSPQQKSKAPHRAGTSKAKPSMNQRDRQGWAGLGWAKQRGMPDEVVPGHSRVWPFLP